MTTMNVKDADGNTVAIEKPLAPGRTAAATSRPVALSTEDLAVLSSIDTKLTTLAGYVDGLEALSTALNGYVDGVETLIGTTNTALSSEATLLGAVTETAPASDTASSGLNGRLQRVAQRLTSLIALLPASIGAKAASGSLSVTTATDDNTLAMFGAVTETAPASDTASSGLNGRLQRIAQRITSMTALLPASLGQKAMTTSLAVAVASDQSSFPVHPGASAAAGGISSTARVASAAATTNATLVKASAGRVYSAQGINAAAYPVYLVLYDAITNPPVPGTTAIRKKIPLPAGAAFALDWPLGMSFATGIGFAFTKLAADADTTALVAGDILQFNMDYN